MFFNNPLNLSAFLCSSTCSTTTHEALTRISLCTMSYCEKQSYLAYSFHHTKSAISINYRSQSKDCSHKITLSLPFLQISALITIMSGFRNWVFFVIMHHLAMLANPLLRARTHGTAKSTTQLQYSLLVLSHWICTVINSLSSQYSHILSSHVPYTCMNWSFALIKDAFKL